MEDLRIAAAEKCPLCGGDVILGECGSCGYAVPDTEKMSAPYDLDPDNVLFGDAALDFDDDDIPSIAPPDASDLPTVEQQRQAARLKRQAARQKAAERSAERNSGGAGAASPQIKENTETVSSAVFAPYTKPVYGEPEPPDPSYVPNMVVKSVSDFVVHHWWKFLLTAILPSVGYGFAFFYFVINMDKDRKKSELFFAGAVLLTTIILQAVHWDPTGFDIIIQYFIKGFLTRGRHYY